MHQLQTMLHPSFKPKMIFQTSTAWNSSRRHSRKILIIKNQKSKISKRKPQQPKITQLSSQEPHLYRTSNSFNSPNDTLKLNNNPNPQQQVTLWTRN